MDADTAGAEPSTTASDATAAASGFAKRKNRGNIRKKADDEHLEEQVDDTSVIRKAKQLKGDPLSFSTKRDDKEEVGVKYEGAKTIQANRDDMATRQLETETEFDRDARALREQVLLQAAGGASNDTTYKGLNNYIDYRQGFRREHTIAGEKGTGSHGPLRGSAYMRVSARFDYQPDICKDYKETGFCSYGDSCKFLHDRGDYKSGWELEKQWDEEQKRKTEAMLKGWNPDGNGEDEEDAAAAQEDELPFACFQCRLPWEECKNPVITKCKHYFCEKCALQQQRKAGKCAACEQPTHGIFNVAQDILKKMNKAQ